MRSRRIMIALICIHKDDLLGVKIEIDHQTIKVINKIAYNYRSTNITNEDWFLCLAIIILGWLYIIALEAVAVEGILIICVDGHIWQCHLIISDISDNYEEQVVITCIKSGLQCSIYPIPLEECKNLCKVWLKQTYKSERAQLVQKNTVEYIEENCPKYPDCMHSMTNFA